MKVYKFGGASVRHAEGVRNLLNIVSGEEELFIIVSAMGKTTNALEEVFDAMRKGETITNNSSSPLTIFNRLRQIYTHFLFRRI